MAAASWHLLHWWGYLSCAALHLAWPGRPLARKRSMWWAAVYDCAAFSMSHSFPSPLAHRLDLLCARSHWKVALACCCPHAAAYSALLSAAPLRRFGSSTCLRTTSAAFASVCTFECGRGAMPGGACAVDQLTSLFHRILARFLAGAGPHVVARVRQCRDRPGGGCWASRASWHLEQQPQPSHDVSRDPVGPR